MNTFLNLMPVWSDMLVAGGWITAIGWVVTRPVLWRDL